MKASKDTKRDTNIVSKYVCCMKDRNSTERIEYILNLLRVYSNTHSAHSVVTKRVREMQSKRNINKEITNGVRCAASFGCFSESYI